ncbi:hypothetical protein GIB67_020979 [Kingdonia uniflora]|uniref:Reverse transcriptase zinc-binding domain-containing protein n=1 Tax=Kingdonia uniflora TaxID=39325 RepID=A0A7J7M7P4_9MAGN|nr:hypothetical protein GIB67_020979 [Kingdonia uniflora]
MIEYYKKPSIWPGVKRVLLDMKDNIFWMVRNGKKVFFWHDHWISESTLADQVPGNDTNNIVTVDQVLHDGEWTIPDNLKIMFQNMGIVFDLVLTDTTAEDECFWKPDSRGRFTTKPAFNEVRHKLPKVWWYSLVWKIPLMPKYSNFGWRLMHNALPTDSELQYRGITTVTCCHFCKKGPKTISHVFWHCEWATAIRDWGIQLFTLNGGITNF